MSSAESALAECRKTVTAVQNIAKQNDAIQNYNARATQDFNNLVKYKYNGKWVNRIPDHHRPDANYRIQNGGTNAGVREFIKYEPHTKAAYEEKIRIYDSSNRKKFRGNSKLGQRNLFSERSGCFGDRSLAKADCTARMARHDPVLRGMTPGGTLWEPSGKGNNDGWPQTGHRCVVAQETWNCQNTGNYRNFLTREIDAANPRKLPAPRLEDIKQNLKPFPQNIVCQDCRNIITDTSIEGSSDVALQQANQCISNIEQRIERESKKAPLNRTIPSQADQPGGALPQPDGVARFPPPQFAPLRRPETAVVSRPIQDNAVPLLLFMFFVFVILIIVLLVVLL